MKNFVKKYPIFALVIGLGLLILIQQKVVMPLVLEVVKSDAFLVESKDEASMTPISNNLTIIAYQNCTNEIKAKLGAETPVSFPDKPLNAWSLGNYQYIISGEATVSGNDPSTAGNKKYACRINYTKGDDQSGSADVENWSIQGISGFDF